MKKGRFGVHFQFWKCWLGISTVPCWVLNQTEVLEPQDPKPASRASSGRPTPQLALKFGLGASLKMPNLHDKRNYLESHQYERRTRKSPSRDQNLCLSAAKDLSFFKGTLSIREPFRVEILSNTVFCIQNTPCINPKQANKAYI